MIKKQIDKNLYYPSLDGLRFLAFLIVFLHHSLLNISSNNILINYFLVIVQKNGWIGVDLFFILSGFLITTLLLEERRINKSFSLKNFWLRRALRIWPLYFLALLFGFFIQPYFVGINISNSPYSEEIEKNLPFYVTFLGNWVVSLGGYSNFSNISHLWTISLEEQFYFFWPILLIFITNIKRSFLAFSIILLLSIFTRFYLSLNNTTHPGIYTNTLARIDVLTLGAIFSLGSFYKPKIKKLLIPMLNPISQLLILIIFTYLLYKIYLFNPEDLLNVTLGYLLISIFLLYFVIASLFNKKTSYLLSNKILVYLGKISFGLYIWHIFAIEIMTALFSKTPLHFLTVPLSLLLTIFFGAISYHFFEIKFLKLKSKFTVIKSRSI